MTTATPGRELLAELSELIALSGDPNVSSAALGMRIRNRRQLYADMKQALRLAPAEQAVRDADGAVQRIPTGVYFDAQGANFYSVEWGRGCGQQFYSDWRDRAGDFPQTKEAAKALMPKWFDMKIAPRNATEIILKIPAPGWPGYYAQIGHWAEMDGSEQPPCKGWFRNTGHGFVQLDEPSGWLWASLPHYATP
jgi:hypothetical protein